ncbi:MAG: hypothetical protein HKN97_08530 [Myxococcales bacterium]|nr:hypothetical protein [Deltaproteobacteria bacterium]NND28619.1 hypothetical protein [Myxococcales bacterium]MBT8481343.1 hypothetical protein [Deltaproteobacteria bacterium]NNK06961.1 hypothetical protein [Myxococcales bacterium]NNK44867.1 hypothetical protein [Myxococcales bacterium]
MDDATYDFGDEEASAEKPRRPGLPVEPRRLLWVLRDQRKRLLKVFVVASVIALLGSFFVPQTFESSAQLLYEGTPALERAGARPTPDAFVDAAIAPSRLREVRDRLSWDVSLEGLESQVEVTLEAEAAMRIVGRASGAERAQALTQAVLEVFLARQASFNKGRLERLTAENAQGLEHAKETRNEAVAAYEVFREESGKPDVLQEKTQLLARADQLRTEAEAASVEIVAQQARINELEKAQKELPRQMVASAKRGSPVDSPLAQARSELASARASLSEQHPRVQALKQRVASLQAQRKGQKAELGEQTMAVNPARAAVDQELATARAELAGAKERESALLVLLKTIRAEIESLSPDEGEARQLLGAAEAAEERFTQLSERAAELRDASLGPMTGFRVLSFPMVPEESHPSGPYVVLLVMLPIVAALIFAIAIIVGRLRSLTVEAPREVAWWGNGPVLGTSVWPRDPGALETFVDELEDYGMYGAGRTLVVPATEVERDIACSFAMRLADAPWLAAAILDVGERAGTASSAAPVITPAPSPQPPAAPSRPRRLSSQAGVSAPPGARPSARPTIQGVVPPSSSSPSGPPVVTPPPKPQDEAEKDEKQAYSSRPPRKKTMIGLPAVQSSRPPGISTSPPSVAPVSTIGSSEPPRPSSQPEPFRRKRGARATVRMMVPLPDVYTPERDEATGDAEAADEEAFLLTRPVPVATEQSPSRAGRAVHVRTETPAAGASNAVMSAAVRLLGDTEEELRRLRPSDPPDRAVPSSGSVRGVALAWNGPLSGPVLRRAARLAHRVMVVVSSGISVIELARIQTRLGRTKGVGYVLVNVGDAYVDLQDRVGTVEEFWDSATEAEA